MAFKFLTKAKRITAIKWARLVESRKGKMDKDTAMIYTIVRAMAKHPKTKMLTAPVSHTYYLENKDLGYFIVVEYDRIRITNHTFFSYKSLNPSDGDKIINYIKMQIENSRKIMEDEIFQNQYALYHSIYDNLKQST